MKECTCEATVLTETLPTPIFEDGPAVARYYHKYAELVDERDRKLFAVWVALIKWKQGIKKFCPLCEINPGECCDCSLFKVYPGCCNNKLEELSPWQEACRGNKQPLLDALIAAVQYEIDALGDEYDVERLRGVLRGDSIEKHFRAVDERLRGAAEGEEKTELKVVGADSRKTYWQYKCPHCKSTAGNNFAEGSGAYKDAKAGGYKTKCPRCEKEFIVSVNSKEAPPFEYLERREAEPPTVIADEGPDGLYRYECPHCGVAKKNIAPTENMPLFCWNCDLLHTVRRRTRFERWHKKQTPLYCVATNRPWVAHPDVYQVKMDSITTTGKPYLKIDGLDCYIDEGKGIAYLGESLKDAYEAAAEKWKEDETELNFVNVDFNKGIIITGRLTSFHVGFGGWTLIDFEDSEYEIEERYPLGKFLLTPDRRRAIEWLDAKLEEASDEN